MAVYIGEERCAPYFETDYLISWDFSASDDPCVTVMRLEKDKDSPRVVGRVLGSYFEKSGVVSLRQLLDFIERENRADEREN